jgi:DNA-binding protein
MEETPKMSKETESAETVEPEEAKAKEPSAEEKPKKAAKKKESKPKPEPKTEAKKEAKAEAPKSRRDESVVFVGSKPLMSYITACVTQLNRNPEELVIKARGRAISRAVDVAEVLRNRFMTDLVVRQIDISTEQVKTAEGNVANVSAMEITLVRGPK